MLAISAILLGRETKGLLLGETADPLLRNNILLAAQEDEAVILSLFQDKLAALEANHDTTAGELAT